VKITLFHTNSEFLADKIVNHGCRQLRWQGFCAVLRLAAQLIGGFPVELVYEQDIAREAGLYSLLQVAIVQR